MRNIYYIPAILFLLICSSCGNDWLNLEPSTQVHTDKSLTNLREIEFALNGNYSTMKSSDAYSGRFVYYGDVTADDVQANSSTKRTGRYYLYELTQDNASTSFWGIPYSIIHNSNIILEAMDRMAIEEREASVRDNLKGQALVMRAMSLFDMTRFYGLPYPVDQGASWGAPIVDALPQINFKPRRNTVAECYKSVIDDLTTAIPLLSTKANNGRINRWAAMTLLSRVYLYKEDNELAFSTAEAAIQGAMKAGYRLWTNEEYEEAWSNEFTSEVFFELINLNTDNPGKEAMGYLCSSAGYVDMNLTTSFMALMNEDPNDIRQKVIKFNGSYYFINKYPGQKSEVLEAANIPLFRMSELYLNAAEAAVKLKGKGMRTNEDVIQYLDPIVKRANPEKSVQGETITLERVLNEKRKEFFGEGHRFFDAMRNKITIERNDVKGVPGKTKHLSMLSQAKKFDWTFFKIVLPIPKAELDANENMRDQQNPGY